MKKRKKKKASIGKSPKYTGFEISDIPGLTKGDNLVLKMSCESELEEYDDIVDPKKVFVKDGKFIIPEDELKKSLEILDQYGYIEIHKLFGSELDSYSILPHGFEEYAYAYIPDYQKILQDVAGLIVNQNVRENVAIAETLHKPLYLIDHFFRILEANDHVKLSSKRGVIKTIFNVSASLKRSLL